MRPQPHFPVHPRFRLHSRAGFGVIEELMVGIAVRIDLGGPNQSRHRAAGSFGPSKRSVSPEIRERIE